MVDQIVNTPREAAIFDTNESGKSLAQVTNKDVNVQIAAAGAAIAQARALQAIASALVYIGDQMAHPVPPPVRAGRRPGSAS